MAKKVAVPLIVLNEPQVSLQLPLISAFKATCSQDQQVNITHNSSTTSSNSDMVTLIYIYISVFFRTKVD